MRSPPGSYCQDCLFLSHTAAGLQRKPQPRRDGAGLVEIFWYVNWPCFHTSLSFQLPLHFIYLFDNTFTIHFMSKSSILTSLYLKLDTCATVLCPGWCGVRVESLGRRGHNFIFYSSSLILRSWISQRNKTFQTLIRNHCVIFLSEGRINIKLFYWKCGRTEDGGRQKTYLILCLICL